MAENDPCGREPCRQKVAEALQAQHDAQRASGVLHQICVLQRIYFRLLILAAAVLFGAVMNLIIAMALLPEGTGIINALTIAVAVLTALFLWVLGIFIKIQAGVKRALRACIELRYSYLIRWSDMNEECEADCLPFVDICCECH